MLGSRPSPDRPATNRASPDTAAGTNALRSRRSISPPAPRSTRCSPVSPTVPFITSDVRWPRHAQSRISRRPCSIAMTAGASWRKVTPATVTWAGSTRRVPRSCSIEASAVSIRISAPNSRSSFESASAATYGASAACVRFSSRASRLAGATSSGRDATRAAGSRDANRPSGKRPRAVALAPCQPARSSSSVTTPPASRARSVVTSTSGWPLGPIRASATSRRPVTLNRSTEPSTSTCAVTRPDPSSAGAPGTSAEIVGARSDRSPPASMDNVRPGSPKAPAMVIRPSPTRTSIPGVAIAPA